MSWLFDLTAAFVDLVAHPSLPPSIRDLLLPYVYGYVDLCESTTNHLRLHHVHAEHKGTGLEGSWRALQAQIRLGSSEQGFTTDVIDGTLSAIRKELLNQELKHATKTVAQRVWTSSAPTSTAPLATKKGKHHGPAPPPHADA